MKVERVHGVVNVCCSAVMGVVTGGRRGLFFSFFPSLFLVGYNNKKLNFILRLQLGACDAMMMALQQRTTADKG